VSTSLPRVTFVLGKGGVGRSTVSAALGAALAAAGERVLVLEWTVAEAIAPWFGLSPAGVAPVEIAPRLWVADYQLRWALSAYFVDHLHLARFYHHVIDGPQLRRLIEAAPGVAELLFLGQLWWLTTLAADEAGLRFDRVVVDAPATGHGVSILKLPATLATFGATGLLALEAGRVHAMMTDPAWTGSLVVAQAEELAIEETLELIPHATADLGRPPLAAFVNRSAARLESEDDEAASRALDEVAARLSPGARGSLCTLVEELRARARRARALREALVGKTVLGDFELEDVQLHGGAPSPRAVVEALAPTIARALSIGEADAGRAGRAKDEGSP
jgi:anion-transporting  ArsA/GET3 family ATPase